jgi:nucleotide-binding universal stress UspA family protein
MRAFKCAAKLAAGNSKGAVVSLSVHDQQGSHHACPKGVFADYVYELTGTEIRPLHGATELAAGPLEPAVSMGHVAEEIVKIAESGGFDLIVMGTKGRSPLGDPLMGSVAQKVVSGTRLPVMLVK